MDDQRRDFVKKSLLTCSLVGATGLWGYLAYHDQPLRQSLGQAQPFRNFSPPASVLSPDLAVVRGSKVQEMTQAALEALGGMGRFVQKGDVVLLKPNIGWDRLPEQAANTNPDLVAEVVLACRQAGAAQVWVGDNSVNDPERSLVRSGVQAAVQQAGGQVWLPQKAAFVPSQFGGEVLQVWPVPELVHRVDKLINLPVAKHHSLTGCTLGMKNWYGLLGGKRNRLHQKIHQSIADLGQALRPSLTILDATRVLKQNGPTGGSLEDVEVMNLLVAGTDPVALDTWALRLFGLKPEQVPYLALGQARGLGQVDLGLVKIKEIQTG